MTLQGTCPCPRCAYDLNLQQWRALSSGVGVGVGERLQEERKEEADGGDERVEAQGHVVATCDSCCERGEWGLGMGLARRPRVRG